MFLRKEGSYTVETAYNDVHITYTVPSLNSIFILSKDIF